MKLNGVFEPAKEGGYTSFIEEFPGVFHRGEKRRIDPAETKRETRGRVAKSRENSLR